MIFFMQLLALHIVHGTFALGTLYKSTASCYGVTSPASNFMFSSCPPGEVIAIKDLTVAYKAAALNCTFDNVQDQFQLCCSNITEQDCQISYNFHPNNAVQYIEKCNGRRSCNVMATVVLPQDCIGVPDHYPNYMHINYYCIPETSILSIMTGTITSLGQSVYLQSPGFNYGQNIPSEKTLTCSVHTCDMGSTLSITPWQIVMENKWGQCQQRLIVRRPDGNTIDSWNCQDNTASPRTLQISEQSLTIQLENSLASDSGSFWLGFAGSSPDGRVTVSCPPETNPCAGISSTINSISTNTTIAITTDSTSTPMVTTSTTTTTTTATTSISTTAGQSSTSNITTENPISTINEETFSNSKTTLGSTQFETSTIPEHKEGLWKTITGIIVAVVAVFIIAIILSIVFSRRRINKKKPHQNVNPEPSTPTAVSNTNTNGIPNPDYASSISTYVDGRLGRGASLRTNFILIRNSNILRWLYKNNGLI